MTTDPRFYMGNNKDTFQSPPDLKEIYRYILFSA